MVFQYELHIVECKSCLLIWVGWFEIEKSIAYLFNSFPPRPMYQEGKRWRRCRTTPTTLSTPSWSSPCRSATCHYYRTRKCAKKKFQVSCLEQPDEAFIRALNIHDWFICFCFTTPFSISDATKTYPCGFVISAGNAWSAKWIYKGFGHFAAKSLSVGGLVWDGGCLASGY